MADTPETPKPSEGRTKNGRFKKGVKNGGPRPGSGRRPNLAKEALLAYITNPFHKDPDGRSLLEVSWDLAYEALIARDENGNPTLAGIRVWQTLLQYKEGKPVERREVKVSAIHLISEVDKLIDHSQAAALTRTRQLPKEIINAGPTGTANGSHPGSANGKH